MCKKTGAFFLAGMVWAFASVLFFLPGPAAAMESRELYLQELSGSPVTTPQSEAGMVLVPAQDEWLAVGTFDFKNSSIPTINHLTLLDEHGSQYPLLIEHASLRYQADQIHAMRFAFQGKKAVLRNAHLRLVWNPAGETVAENREVTWFKFDFNHPERFRSVAWRAAKPTADAFPTIVIDVTDVPAWHRLGYLLPLGILGLLLWLEKKFLRKKTK